MLSNVRKRVLIVTALFPPDVIGGAEISACDLAMWLRDQGAEVGVLTTAKAKEDELDGVLVDGLRIWRIFMPRPHPLLFHSKAPQSAKRLWHFKDHFDRSNRRVMSRVIDEFKPEFIDIHLLQGLGYNSLLEIGRRDIPTMYFLHDLGLACVRMGMFRNGQECQSQCGLCSVSSSYKRRLVSKVPRLGFCSPSFALLEKMKQIFPIGKYQNTSIRNANKFPPPTKSWSAGERFRFLYVGGLYPSKGVEFLLEILSEMADSEELSVTVVGKGPEDAKLRERFGGAPWCRFTGFISQAEISNHMVESDVLCVPSMWLENSPGVVIHALGLGLPVIGSDKGGIPELVEDGFSGRLVRPGDKEAWRTALTELIRNPELLCSWRQNLEVAADQFGQDAVGRKYLEFREKIAHEGRP